MRFGPQATLLAGPGLRSAPGCCCSPARRSTAATSTDVLPRDGPARPRRRARLPVADDAGDVGRDAERRRPRLGPRQHERAGRRRDRPRRAGDARDRAHRQPARRRRVGGGRAQRAATTSPTWSAPALVVASPSRSPRPCCARAARPRRPPSTAPPSTPTAAARSPRTPTRAEYDRARARSPVLHRLRRGQRADRLRSDGAAGRLRARPAGHGAEGVLRAARAARAARLARRRRRSPRPTSSRSSASGRPSTASPARWPSACTTSPCTCATATTATPRACGPTPPTPRRCAPTSPRCPASAR